MIWTIHRDGRYFVASHNGHSFELGEMGKDRWLLRHWPLGKSSSDWHDATSAEDGKAKAEEISK
jgi:hypothetical protein